MSDVITLSELDGLRVTKAQLQYELAMERIQKQADEVMRGRDAVLTTTLLPYLPEGTSLKDFTINLEAGTLTPRPEDEPAAPALPMN